MIANRNLSKIAPLATLPICQYTLADLPSAKFFEFEFTQTEAQAEALI
jgi:hypothetical protein